MQIIVKVKPKSKINHIEKLTIGNNTYLAKINAAPEKGKANLALIDLLANYFDTKKNNIKILKGLKSSTKIINIEKKV